MGPTKMHRMVQPKMCTQKTVYWIADLGGLAAAVERSISSIDKEMMFGGDYLIKAGDLSILGNDRTRAALVELLEKGVKGKAGGGGDEEEPSSKRKMEMEVLLLVEKMRSDEAKGPFAEHSPEEIEADKNADIAANVLTTALLQSSPECGIDPREVEHRREYFGTNAIADKELDSFCALCFEAVQDFVLIMLIVLGIISIAVETTIGLEGGEKCGPCWIEGAAILVSVCIVVFVTAGIDYAKQFAFIRLTRSLHETNTKAVIRDGKQVFSRRRRPSFVGDILSVNSPQSRLHSCRLCIVGPCC